MFSFHMFFSIGRILPVVRGRILPVGLTQPIQVACAFGPTKAPPVNLHQTQVHQLAQRITNAPLFQAQLHRQGGLIGVSRALAVQFASVHRQRAEQ
jgi:hypothetical protein